MRILFRAGMGRWLLASMAAVPVMAVGQPGPATSSGPESRSETAADRLAANLVILSQNPRDVRALTDAGLSAIAVGDGDAALSFLARAEEISPRDGRIKAAIGSALLLKQKPNDALRLFGEAADLGVTDQFLARERGLAHDLRGDPKRAQRDYALALQSAADDDLTIRYALSLGISGDSQKAFDMLDPLLRQRNMSAWRARAFVLAMKGDLAEAESVATNVMPGGSGASMSPFLRRLAKMNSADRALAVNFGIMPSDGRSLAMTDTASPYLSDGGRTSAASDGLIPAGEPLGPRGGDREATTPKPAAESKEPRRRPGSNPNPTAEVAARPASNKPDPSSSARVGPRIGPVDPERYPEEVRAAMTADGKKSPAPRVVVTGATSLPPPSGAQKRDPAPAVARAEQPAPRFEVPADIAVRPATPPAPAPVQPSPTTERPDSGPDLGEIVSHLAVEKESVAAPLPTTAQLRAARIAAQRKAAAEEKAAATEKAAREAREAERLAARKNPARVWVQVATGSNEAGLPGTWRKIREQAPVVLKNQSASSVPFKATNRLLVGPFKSQAEARAMVNALKKEGLQSSTFASEAGQVVTKVSTK